MRRGRHLPPRPRPSAAAPSREDLRSGELLLPTRPCLPPDTPRVADDQRFACAGPPGASASNRRSRGWRRCSCGIPNGQVQIANESLRLHAPNDGSRASVMLSDVLQMNQSAGFILAPSAIGGGVPPGGSAFVDIDHRLDHRHVRPVTLNARQGSDAQCEAVSRTRVLARALRPKS